MTHKTERALCALLNHEMAGAEEALFEWAPEPWSLQVKGSSVVKRLLELAEEANSPDDKHRWWEWVPRLAEKKRVQLSTESWCRALNTLWRNQGIDERERIKGIDQLTKVASSALDWGQVADVVALIPHVMRSDKMIQALVESGMDKNQEVKDRWNGVMKSPTVSCKLKELFSPVWLVENGKEDGWSEEEWQGLWWRTKWLADQSLREKLENVSPSLQDRNAALLMWAKKRGSNTNDLFLAIDSAWDVGVMLDRISVWSVATRKTHAQVWSMKDVAGTPLWMSALARHPTLLKSMDQPKMKGFRSVLNWEMKDEMGRDGLAYLGAGILLGVQEEEAPALWEMACAKACLVPILKESEEEKKEKHLELQRWNLIQKIIKNYKDQKDFDKDVDIINLFAAASQTSEALNVSKKHLFAECRPHHYEDEWKLRLEHAVDVAIKWSNKRVAHPVPVEVAFERGEGIAKSTWEEVKNLLPKLASASFESGNWGWINPDIKIEIKDLELAVKKQPELVDWAGGRTLWKLIHPNKFGREGRIEEVGAIKTWIEMGLNCEKWGEILKLKLVEHEQIYDVAHVKKWWAEEIKPLWERQLLKKRVGLISSVQREDRAL